MCDGFTFSLYCKRWKKGHMTKEKKRREDPEKRERSKRRQERGPPLACSFFDKFFFFFFFFALCWLVFFFVIQNKVNDVSSASGKSTAFFSWLVWGSDWHIYIYIHYICGGGRDTKKEKECCVCFPPTQPNSLRFLFSLWVAGFFSAFRFFLLLFWFPFSKEEEEASWGEGGRHTHMTV